MSTSTTTPRLLTPAQVADMVGVSASSIRNYCSDGRLRYVRLPGSGHRRIHPDDAAELAASLRIPETT